MLKVLAFDLEKQKSFIPRKYFLSRCQYQNKKGLFTDAVFSEGFGNDYVAFSLTFDQFKVYFVTENVQSQTER